MNPCEAGEDEHEEPARQQADWQARTSVWVGRTSYAIRFRSDGGLEVCIDGRWREQELFLVYDDVSLRDVVEIMVHRYRTGA